jgi:drug/metabolite transporter (DMT)-like permease
MAVRLPILFAYLTLYIVWGSTYFFIKLAVETIPPFWVVGLRFLLGGSAFLVFAAATGRLRPLPGKREVLSAALLGLCLLAGGNGLVTAAEKTVDSHLAALVLAATPLAVALFDRFLVGKRISALRLAGILLGMGGVTLLVYDGHSLVGSFSPGILLVLGGLVSWSFATSLGHRVRTPPDAVTSSGIQMFTVGLAASLAMLMTGPPPAGLLDAVSMNSWIALGALAVAGSLAFAAYTWLIRREPAIRVVSYAFVNPLIAILLGMLVAGETPRPLLGPGTLLVLAGLALMLFGDALRERLARRRP